MGLLAANLVARPKIGGRQSQARSFRRRWLRAPPLGHGHWPLARLGPGLFIDSDEGGLLWVRMDSALDSQNRKSKSTRRAAPRAKASWHGSAAGQAGPDSGESDWRSTRRFENRPDRRLSGRHRAGSCQHVRVRPIPSSKAQEGCSGLTGIRQSTGSPILASATAGGGGGAAGCGGVEPRRAPVRRDARANVHLPPEEGRAGREVDERGVWA